MGAYYICFVFRSNTILIEQLKSVSFLTIPCITYEDTMENNLESKE